MEDSTALVRQLDICRLQELKSFGNKLGLKTSGRKSELCDRIIQHLKSKNFVDPQIIVNHIISNCAPPSIAGLHHSSTDAFNPGIQLPRRKRTHTTAPQHSDPPPCPKDSYAFQTRRNASNGGRSRNGGGSSTSTHALRSGSSRLPLITPLRSASSSLSWLATSSCSLDSFPLTTPTMPQAEPYSAQVVQQALLNAELSSVHRAASKQKTLLPKKRNSKGVGKKVMPSTSGSLERIEVGSDGSVTSVTPRPPAHGYINCLCRGSYTDSPKNGCIDCSMCGRSVHVDCFKIRDKEGNLCEMYIPGYKLFVCHVCQLSSMDPFAPVISVMFHSRVSRSALSARCVIDSLHLHDWRKVDYLVDVRCVQLQEVDVGGRNVMAWPRTCDIMVNDHPIQVDAPNTDHKRRDAPCVITSFLRPHRNVLSFTFTIDHGYPNYDFAFSVNLCKSLQVENVVDHVRKNSTLDFDDAQSRIREFLSEVRYPSNDDDVICLNSNRRVKLTCPITLCRIDIPVRSCKCRHIQCYDLYSYVEVTKSTKVFNNRWRCPCCHQQALPKDLIVDAFTERMLKSVPPSCRAIEIEKDCSYRCLSAGELKEFPGSEGEGRMKDEEPNSDGPQHIECDTEASSPFENEEVIDCIPILGHGSCLANKEPVKRRRTEIETITVVDSSDDELGHVPDNDYVSDISSYTVGYIPTNSGSSVPIPRGTDSLYSLEILPRVSPITDRQIGTPQASLSQISTSQSHISGNNSVGLFEDTQIIEELEELYINVAENSSPKRSMSQLTMSQPHISRNHSVGLFKDTQIIEELEGLFINVSENSNAATSTSQIPVSPQHVSMFSSVLDSDDVFNVPSHPPQSLHELADGGEFHRYADDFIALYDEESLEERRHMDNVNNCIFEFPSNSRVLDNGNFDNTRVDNWDNFDRVGNKDTDLVGDAVRM